MRIDAHHHFWTLSRDDYGWLAPDLDVLYRDFGPEDLAPLLSSSSIDKTVLVQAAPTLEETEYLLDLSDESDFVAGVVGWMDLEDARCTAETIEGLSLHDKFVGVRPMLQDMEDPSWIAANRLQPSIDMLVANNIRFDALVKSDHLPFLLKFLKRNPDLDCVIDHGGKPDVSEGEWQPWADGMSLLATQTDAYCKLSGLVTEASIDQTADDLKRYVDHLLETFGPKRIIWGSDWPVLNLASNYEEWNSATDRLLGALTNNEVGQIRGRNAIDFYGLALQGD